VIAVNRGPHPSLGSPRSKPLDLADITFPAPAPPPIRVRAVAAPVNRTAPETPAMRWKSAHDRATIATAARVAVLQFLIVR